jgi:hypothetical protein
MDPVTGAALIGGGASLLGGLLGNDAAKDAAKAQQRAAEQALAFQRQQYEMGLGMNEPYRVTGTGALNTLARLYGLPSQQYTPLSELRSQSGGTAGSSTFNAKRVAAMLKRGMSVEDIAKMGTLAAGGRAATRLTKRGLSAEQIGMLQRGPGQFIEDAPYSNLPGSEGGQAGPDMSVFTASPDYQFRRDEGMRGIEQGAAARGGALSGNALRALSGFNSNMASTEFGNFYERMARLAGIGGAATNNAMNLGQNFANNAGNAAMAAGSARASGVANSANIWGNAIGDVGNALGQWWGNRNQTQFNPSAPDVSAGNLTRQRNALIYGS